MDKVFYCGSDTKLSSTNFERVNTYLKENPQAQVVSVTSIEQHGSSTYRDFGVVIVVRN